ncbi:DUF7522 family protein [Halorussus salinus]|uniref:DUF7522 family protein n=1 Tax=Halorussus salinus TaxID=1364935 RepID=UPI0010919745|nr:hypothetical protein [Halorussus salinus]
MNNGEVTDGGEPLVDFLRSKAGDSLRGVIRYDSDDYRFLYVRTDVTEAYGGTSNFEAVVRQYREAEPTESKQEGTLYAGNHHVTVRLYDDAAILHFPQGEEYGTIVSVDPNVAQGLSTFTYDCLERIFRDSPQRISNVPDW